MNAGPDPLEFRQRMLDWFDRSARDLPWRRSRDAYGIWVSEIMLQQTRVAAVLEHYARFTKRFPSLEVLAEASEDEVLAHWSGLGYYRRARMLHKAAQFVARELGGWLPSTAAELRVLPGVGEYTSAAIASIGFGEPVACVDGNVVRVVRRLMSWDEKTGTLAMVRAQASRLLDPKHAGDFNQAMMELGATVCTPRSPHCGQCPVEETCATQGEHSVGEGKKMRSRQTAHALLRRKAEVLLERRPAKAAVMPGMWELPVIEAKEALPDEKALTLRHSITDTNYYVTIYDMGARQKGLPKGKGARKWFAVSDLQGVPITGLTRKALMRLRTWPGFESQ
jgi:A/G-specific adenine glycosylase